MMKKLAAVILSLLPFIATSAYAQSTPGLAAVMGTCGTIAGTSPYVAGSNRPVTQDTNGNQCSAATFSGTVTANNASVGANGSAAPTSSTQLGSIVGGNLQPTSPTNPLPTATYTVSVTTTDRAGTITTGGTAQNAMASNSSRKSWCVQNPSSASEDLFFRSNGTASATTGGDLSPGQFFCSGQTVDTSAVSVFAATTGHQWLAFEAQ